MREVIRKLGEEKDALNCQVRFLQRFFNHSISAMSYFNLLFQNDLLKSKCKTLEMNISGMFKYAGQKLHSQERELNTLNGRFVILFRLV